MVLVCGQRNLFCFSSPSGFCCFTASPKNQSRLAAHREPDEVFGLLLAGVVEVLHPEVEDLLLGVQLGVLRPLPELGDELDVADRRLEVPVE